MSSGEERESNREVETWNTTEHVTRHLNKYNDQKSWDLYLIQIREYDIERPDLAGLSENQMCREVLLFGAIVTRFFYLISMFRRVLHDQFNTPDKYIPSVDFDNLDVFIEKPALLKYLRSVAETDLSPMTEVEDRSLDDVKEFTFDHTEDIMKRFWQEEYGNEEKD